MNYVISDIQAERDKNLKALGITTLTCAAVFLFFFLVSWTLPQMPQPLQDEGIEVNLGNSDFGHGDLLLRTPPLCCMPLAALPGAPAGGPRIGADP